MSYNYEVRLESSYTQMRKVDRDRLVQRKEDGSLMTQTITNEQPMARTPAIEVPKGQVAKKGSCRKEIEVAQEEEGTSLNICNWS